MVSAPVTINTSSSAVHTESSTRNITKYNDAGELGDTNVTTKIYTPGTTTNTTFFSIRPQLQLGASYPVVENRFIANVGLRANPLNYTRTTTTTSGNGDVSTTRTETKNANGRETTATTATAVAPVADSVQVTDFLTAFYANVYAGFTFIFINNQFYLDCGFTNPGGGGFNMDIYQISLMLGIKF
jgi:hypothetical protein